MIDGSKAYYLGTWNRTPFDPSQFPQSLNVLGGRARLDNFDAPLGNLWAFRFVGGASSRERTQVPMTRQWRPGVPISASLMDGGGGGCDDSGGGRCFTLACLNYSHYSDASETKSMVFLGPDLKVVQDENRAQLWQRISYPPLRGTIPGEEAWMIRAHASDKILCSDEKERAVYLLKRSDAQMLHTTTGSFVFNDAWEATPDEEPPEDTLSGLLDKLGG